MYHKMSLRHFSLLSRESATEVSAVAGPRTQDCEFTNRPCISKFITSTKLQIAWYLPFAVLFWSSCYQVVYHKPVCLIKKE